MNVLDRAKVLADEQALTIDDLTREVIEAAAREPSSSPADAASGDADLASIERAHIVAVLERERGNKARAARALGIHRRKLYRLIERLGIEPVGPG
jgi:DNA-binding NtrC family response regulator